jgi:hypothetical protein
MKSICLEVEGSAGESVETICADMCKLSKQLDMLISADINGVQIIATTFSDPKDILDLYFIDLKKNRVALLNSLSI